MRQPSVMTLKKRVASMYPGARVSGPVEVRRGKGEPLLVFHAGQTMVTFQRGDPVQLRAAIENLRRHPIRPRKPFNARQALEELRFRNVR